MSDQDWGSTIAGLVNTIGNLSYRLEILEEERNALQRSVHGLTEELQATQEALGTLTEQGPLFDAFEQRQAQRGAAKMYAALQGWEARHGPNPPEDES